MNRLNQLQFGFGMQAPPPPPLPPPPPPGGTGRRVRLALFFAALPDPRTAMALDAVREALGIELGLPDEGRPKDLLHVSLYGLGLFASLPSEVVRTARRIGEAVKVPAFEVALDRLETFSTRRGHRLVLTSSKGAAAWRPLWDAMGKSFLASGRRAIPFSRFKPHLTLIYDGKLIPRRILATPITLTVRDFVLVLSIHGETRHEHLGRWTLEG